VKISLDELRSLPSGRLDIDFKESFDNVEAIKPVVGNLTITASSTGVRVAGSVQTLLKLNCHRCLNPYFLSLNVPIEEKFIIESYQGFSSRNSQKEPRELSAGDFVETLPADGALDISDVVYQAITLATPTICRCGESCPGPELTHQDSISQPLADDKKGSSCEKPIDPRWRNLKTLFPKDDS
jgi:uncharacterized metal-binding protein YceD (DUF177 family)